MPSLLLLLLLPLTLQAESSDNNTVTRTKKSLHGGATDQEVGEAILSINYRDKLGNLKTLRGRTQELRIKKGEGVRTGELNAGQIATLMKQLKGRTRGRLAALKRKKKKRPRKSRKKTAAQTLQVPPGLAAVPASIAGPVVDYEYEYYDDDYGDDYVEYEEYGEPLTTVVKTIVEEELVPARHHVEEPLHHNEVIPVYSSLDNHDPYSATPVLVHEDHSYGYGQGHHKSHHKPAHYRKPHHPKPHHEKPYHPPPQHHGYRAKNEGHYYVKQETPNYRYEVESYGEPDPYHEPPPPYHESYYEPPPPEPYHKPEPYYEPEPYHKPEPYHRPKTYHEPEPYHQPEPYYEPEPHYEPEPYYKPEPQYRPEPYHPPKHSYEPDPYNKPEPYHEPEPYYTPEPYQKPSYREYHHPKPPPPNHHKSPHHQPYYSGGESVEVRPNVYIELKEGDKHYRPRFGHPYQPEPKYLAYAPEPYEKPHHPKPYHTAPVYHEKPRHYPPPPYPEPAQHHRPPPHHLPNPKPEVLHDPRFGEGRHGTPLVPLPEEEVVGRAFGADLVGGFDHHTGSLGPFGFYANYYDQK